MSKWRPDGWGSAKQHNTFEKDAAEYLSQLKTGLPGVKSEDLILIAAFEAGADAMLKGIIEEATTISVRGGERWVRIPVSPSKKILTFVVMPDNIYEKSD